VRRFLSLLGSGFFTQVCTPRESLFRQIHEIVYHGNGGYDWHTLYNMPIWLRNFTFKAIQEHMDKQVEAQKKASGQASTQAPPKGPGVAPDFTTKRSSK
jgi:hypothetical protein